MAGKYVGVQMSVSKLERTNCDATMLPMPISAEQHLTGLDHARWVERGLTGRVSCSLICSSFFDYPSLLPILEI